MKTRRLSPWPKGLLALRSTGLSSATSGIRPVVLCNAMIYGNAMGAPAQSVQIPVLAQQARASGVARYIGRGLNRWSNVHIADVAALYALAIAKAPAGSFMYVESGEEALGEVVRAIAARLGLGAAQSWPAEQAIAAWGRDEGDVLARLQQPGARQTRNRASRLGTQASFNYGLDCQRIGITLPEYCADVSRRGSIYPVETAEPFRSRTI